MGNLTAFMILRNEELLLGRCLASLAGVVDAVVAVDTGSRDRTVSILQEAARDDVMPAVSWLRQPFRDFGTARQQALDRVQTEWALWIDADEAISPALARRLRELRSSSAMAACDAWEIRLENRVYGRTMRGRNLSGKYHVRLFRREAGRITRSAVHEGLALTPGGRIGRIEEPIIHDTLIGLRQYLAKVNLYTDLETAVSERRFNPLHMLVTGPATFWREYVARRGCRDGWPGIVWAAITAWSSVLRDWKLLQRAVRKTAGGRP